jgi:hypothetical protein|tara:strand:- start:14 stop:205 length:192 start_codon:yes stop_codon:yes gene_type:complete
MQVGDLVKERRGDGKGIIVEVFNDLNMEFGAQPGEYTHVCVLYPSGKLFRQSTRAFEVISESR